MPKFTIEGKGRWMRIVSHCIVSPTPDKQQRTNEKGFACDSAEWDTGSMVTIISERVASELCLKQTGITTISGVDGRPIKANTYLVNLQFPGELKANLVEVVEAPLLTQDLLVGMDIISECNFLYSFKDGKSSLSVSREW